MRIILTIVAVAIVCALAAALAAPAFVDWRAWRTDVERELSRAAGTPMRIEGAIDARLLPIPYKLVTIASGAAHFDLFTFVWASIVTRGARFFILAALLWKFGEPIRAFIEKRLALVTWLFLIALIGGFVALRYLF